MTPAWNLGVHLSSLEREGWGLEQCLAWARGMGIHFFEAGTEIEEMRRSAAEVRQLVDRHNMTFAALEVKATPDLEPQLQWAAEAGCRQVVLAALDGNAADGFYPQIAAAAERWGVAVSVDLGGAILGQAEELWSILERIDSPWLQAAIDTGHVLSAGHDPLELAAAFEGRIGHFRIRTAPCSSGAEHLLRSIIELLTDGDYRVVVSLLEESGRAHALATRVEEVRRTLELTVLNRDQ